MRKEKVGDFMDYLTVAEYAGLRGCSERYARQMVLDGKIKAQEIEGSVGRGGKSYIIPLAAIEPKLIRKWKQRQRKSADPEPEEEALPSGDRTLERLTAEERQEIATWMKIIREWHSYRNTAAKKAKAQADEEFLNYIQAEHPEMKFGKRTLYRKNEALRKQDYIGLLDKRGKHGHQRKAIPDEVFDIFEYFYLDESQKSVAKCVELTEQEILKNREDLQRLLPLPSLDTFLRRVEKIPVPVIQFFRYGKKAFLDTCSPYNRRRYGDLESNDIWVCDNHTFDVLINDEESDKPIRVYLTAFLDIRSRKFMGWYVTKTPCSDATLTALRRGIERYGIPKRIYSDNGREFLTHDIGGRGFRKSADTGEHEPPTILQRMPSLKTCFRMNWPVRSLPCWRVPYTARLAVMTSIKRYHLIWTFRIILRSGFLVHAQQVSPLQRAV